MKQLDQREGFHKYLDPTGGEGLGSELYLWAALLSVVLMDDGRQDLAA